MNISLANILSIAYSIQFNLIQFNLYFKIIKNIYKLQQNKQIWYWEDGKRPNRPEMATPYMNLSYIHINNTSTKQIKHQKNKTNKTMPQNYQSKSSVISRNKT